VKERSKQKYEKEIAAATTVATVAITLLLDQN
jgi:hypothetical protein